MADKGYSPDEMRRMARTLERAAEEFDASARGMPESVDAGPFGPPIQLLMEAVAANCTDLIFRLTFVAENVREAAARYEEGEHVSKGGLEDLLTDGLDDAGD